MKNKINLFIIIFLGIIFLVGLGQMFLRKGGDFNLPTLGPRTLNVVKPNDKTITTTPIPTQPMVAVSIDFGDGKKLSGNLSAKTAYEALTSLAQKNNLAVETKQYKFGKMVVKVGGKENSNEKAWTYLVNGQVGKIASDIFLVNPSDKIEWIYKKI